MSLSTKGLVYCILGLGMAAFLMGCFIYRQHVEIAGLETKLEVATENANLLQAQIEASEEAQKTKTQKQEEILNEETKRKGILSAMPDSWSDTALPDSFSSLFSTNRDADSAADAAK